MKRILYLLFAVICLTACENDDDENSNNAGSVQNVSGEWFCYDEETGLFAMDMNLTENLSYSCITYVNPTTEMKVQDKQSGTWGFFTNTNSIRVSALSEITGMKEMLDFAFVKADDYKLVLRNKSNNGNDVYYKVVNTYNAIVGEDITTDLSQIGFEAIEYMSINSNIATVDNHGIINTKGIGTTFIIAKDSKSNKVTIKLEVISYVEIHASEINSDIETIYKTYGQPDIEQVQDNGSTAILYKNQSIDKSASKIQFNYNSTSHKVTRVLVLYQSREAYLKDTEYLPSVFHTVEFGNYYFCDTDDFYSSTFHILPFEQGGSYYASYGSTSQMILYGHY